MFPYFQSALQAIRPWLASVQRRPKPRQLSRQQRLLSFRPILETLEDRTLLSGTPGALDAFLLTPVPAGAPIAMHIHPHLTILINGQDQVIPAGIGLKANGDLPIHTHDDSGTIHIESPAVQDFTLQNFFTVWGQSFSSQNILGHPVDAADPLILTVNGQVSSALGSMVLHDHDNIVIQYGSAPTAKLSTDRLDYAPGATAVFSGSGFAAGETVALQVVHIDGRPNTDASHTPSTVVADMIGSFRTTWVVDSVDAVGSTLEVKAVGQSSRKMADAIFTDSTNPPVPRPFWIFAHNPDSEAITQQYLQKGVNGLEPDIEYFSASDITSVNNARSLLGLSLLTAQPGFYIAHGNFKAEEVLLGSAYDEPVLPLTDYLTWLSGYLAAGQTQLSLIAFDVKTAAAQASGAIGTILSDIATDLLTNHPDIRSIINAGSQADATSLFTSTADSLFAALPTITGLSYNQTIGFSIDGEDDVVATSAKLRSLLGSDALIGFGDGSAGCCNAAIGILGLNAFFAPNTPGALARAAFERTAFGDLNIVSYAYSVTGVDSMKMLIDQGVDGLIPADNADPTSNLGLAGITSSFSEFGDTADALAVVNAHYDNTYLATTADDPFSIPGAKNGVVTGSRNGYALEVKTSDILGAGTDANITFTLHGKNGAASITLDTSWSHMMERNDTNYVYIPSADLGTLQSVTVSNDGSGGKWGISLNSEWNVDWIKVRSFAYIGTSAGDFYNADYGGQDVGNSTCLDFGLLGSICFDTGDQNPSTRALTISAYLTGTSQATATGGVEGVTGATLTGATFHDRNLDNTSFSVTAVDWGDGSTDATGLTISGSNGNFTVNGAHLYQKEGNYAFSITVKAGGSGPDANQTATIYGEVDVSDPAVVLTPATFRATEGTLSSVQTLATFTDPGGAELLTDYTVDVDWGNGTFVSNDANVSISGPVGGVFTVTGKHLYTDEDGYPGPVQVRITHEATTPFSVVSVVSVPLTLIDPPVSATAATGPFRATEGTMSAVQTLATFTDPGGPETLSEYSVNVDWGNGTFVSGDANLSMSGPVAGVFTVTGKHLYADEDGFTGPIRVRINHEASTPSTVVSVLLTLTDPPVSATAATGPFRATEGTISTVQTLATFTDPGGPETPSDYTVDVDWGNGTFVLGDRNVSISGPVAGVFTVTAQHLYREEDGFPGPVRVRINHEGSTPSPVVSVPLSLTDPPLLAVGTSLTVVRGSCPTQAVATFTDPGGAEPNLFDAGPLSSHYTATIHWGDGTSDDTGAITYNGIPLDDSPTNTFTVSGHHDYTTNGTYTITVTIHHEGAVPDAKVTDKVTVVSVLNHAQGLCDANSLVIGAALSGSSILVVPVGKQTGALTDSVQVLIDGLPQINTATGGTTFTGFNSITIYGQAGNDNLEVAGSVRKNTYIFGGGGNDRMKGGAGNNILVGGAGNDLIIGGTGRDILIGGGGNDRLVGGPGGDILIAGYTDFDNSCVPANAAMLCAIQAAWTNSTATFNAQAAAVLALFSTDGSNAAHIHYVGGAKLTGSAGQDLFFDGIVDPITGKPRGKK
jgi:hypothetical protein